MKYRVERASADDPPTWTLRGETEKTTFTDGGRAGCDVADSTKYRYRVMAVNRVGAVGAPAVHRKNKSWRLPRLRQQLSNS